MAWSKLDEDRAAPDEAWSAFLLKGLVDNVNSYATDLAPGFSAVWSYQEAPQWASLLSFAGGTVVFNVGSFATEVKFYLSIAHHPTLSGYLKVLHPATGSSYIATVSPAATTVEITLPLSSPASGPQEFQVLYKSTVANASIGHFHCFTAIGNQISVRDATLTVAANVGRQFWAVELDGSNVDVGQPMPPGGWHMYQVGRVNPIVNIGGGQHADGYLITWPDVESNPPILRTTSTFVAQAGNYVQGNIFVLSWLKLNGMACEVTESRPPVVPMVYAHDLATSVESIPRAQRFRAGNNLIQVAANPGTNVGFMGCLITPAAPLFKIVTREEKGPMALYLRMRGFRYEGSTAAPEITITITEVTAGPNFNPLQTITLGPQPFPLARARRAISETVFSVLSLNGVNLGPGMWGMADAAFEPDLVAGYVLTQDMVFDLGYNFGTPAAYVIQVDSTVPIYVSSFYLGAS